MPPVVALLTDFGQSDTYVGVMKGVILGICPEARLVDLTHAVAPQDVRQGAFLLANAYPYFPAGTVFLVVVDPGVGTARRAIAVEGGGYRLVAPDNGVLSYALAHVGAFRAVALVDPRYRLSAVSQTFHGRDIFAPAAAHLAAGVALDALGPAVPDPVLLPPLRLEVGAGQLRGEVVHVDHFGNLVTSIGPLAWDADGRLTFAADTRLNPAAAWVTARGAAIHGVQRRYGDTAPGTLLAMVGSSGHLEIAVHGGSAAARLGAQPGDTVELVFAAEN